MLNKYKLLVVLQIPIKSQEMNNQRQKCKTNKKFGITIF